MRDGPTTDTEAMAGESLRYVYIDRARCPACGSVNVKTTRSVNQGDGMRHAHGQLPRVPTSFFHNRGMTARYWQWRDGRRRGAGPHRQGRRRSYGNGCGRDSRQVGDRIPAGTDGGRNAAGRVMANRRTRPANESTGLACRVFLRSVLLIWRGGAIGRSFQGQVLCLNHQWQFDNASSADDVGARQPTRGCAS